MLQQRSNAAGLKLLICGMPHSIYILECKSGELQEFLNIALMLHSSNKLSLSKVCSNYFLPDTMVLPLHCFPALALLQLNLQLQLPFILSEACSFSVDVHYCLSFDAASIKALLRYANRLALEKLCPYISKAEGGSGPSALQGGYYI